jgi:hypothetical protein
MMATEAEKNEAKRKFKQDNPDGPRMSVNVGGYGNLSFKNDSEYSQFQKDPQSMTYSQGPGGRKYVEPKAADYDTRFKDVNPSGAKAKDEDELTAGRSAYAKGGMVVNKGVGASMKPHNVFGSKGKK